MGPADISGQLFEAALSELVVRVALRSCASFCRMTYYGQGLDEIAEAVQQHAKAVDRFAAAFERWVDLQAERMHLTQESIDLSKIGSPTREDGQPR